MSYPTKEKPSIKFVKKANAYSITYFVIGEKSKTQVIEWSVEKP